MPVDSDVIADTSPPAVSSGGEPAVVDTSDTEEASAHTAVAQTAVAVGGPARRVRSWRRILVYGVLPGLALILAMAAGYLKWLDSSVRESQAAAEQSVAVATDGAIALLSYRPDTVEKELPAAVDRLTGSFRDAYTKLVNDVVIPGAKQQQISAVATVPAAASVTAGEKHAVVLVFVNQAITIGNDAPTTTASSIRITLNKVHDRWLISQFEPI